MAVIQNSGFSRFHSRKLSLAQATHVTTEREPLSIAESSRSAGSVLLGQWTESFTDHSLVHKTLNTEPAVTRCLITDECGLKLTQAKDSHNAVADTSSQVRRTSHGGPMECHELSSDSSSCTCTNSIACACTQIQSGWHWTPFIQWSRGGHELPPQLKLELSTNGFDQSIAVKTGMISPLTLDD